MYRHGSPLLTVLDAGRHLTLWCALLSASSCISGGPDFTLACLPMDAAQYDALETYNGPERCLDSPVECASGQFLDLESASCQPCPSDTSASVTCSGPCECTPLAGTSSGTISDGSGDYLNDQECVWLISAEYVSITFTAFATEGNYDWVDINQCQDSSCSSPEQLARLSGSAGADQTYSSSTGFLQVRFTSDGSSTRSGFVADWSAQPGQCDAGPPSPPPPPPPPPPTSIEECAFCDSSSGCPLPCTYGGCTFDKTDGTNALARSGSCSGRTATLYLNRRGIASVPAGVFDDIAPS